MEPASIIDEIGEHLQFCLYKFYAHSVPVITPFGIMSENKALLPGSDDTYETTRQRTVGTTSQPIRNSTHLSATDWRCFEDFAIDSNASFELKTRHPS